MSNESSVLFALKELHALEESRQAEDEAARRAASEKVRAAADATEAAEREARLRIEAEAKARVDAEARTRDLDADRRLAALRAELMAVQSERERLRHAAVSTVIEPSTTSRAWPWAFAVVTSAAAALAVALVASSSTTPVVVAPAVAPIAAPAPVAEAMPELAPPVAPLVVPAVTVTPPADPHPHHVRDHGPHGHVVTGHTGGDILHLDCPENDPTCGVDE